MLEIDLDLPAGALADAPAAALAEAIAAAGGVWLRGTAEAFMHDESGAVEGWGAWLALPPGVPARSAGARAVEPRTTADAGAADVGWTAATAGAHGAGWPGRAGGAAEGCAAAADGWAEAAEGMVAVPTGPSAGRVRTVRLGADQGLLLTPGRHGGMVLPGLDCGGGYSLAVIYVPAPAVAGDAAALPGAPPAPDPAADEALPGQPPSGALAANRAAGRTPPQDAARGEALQEPPRGTAAGGAEGGARSEGTSHQDAPAQGAPAQVSAARAASSPGAAVCIPSQTAPAPAAPARTGAWPPDVPWAGPARTLLAVNPGGRGAGREAGGYLFLSQDDAGWTVKETASDTTLTVPDPQPTGAPPHARMVLLSVGRSGLALSIDGGAAVRGAAPPLPPPETADLFVGCRSQRPGLLRTLGASVIRDVVFLPGLDLLADDPPPAAPLSAPTLSAPTLSPPKLPPPNLAAPPLHETADAAPAPPALGQAARAPRAPDAPAPPRHGPPHSASQHPGHPAAALRQALERHYRWSR